nr:hypothetical protein [Holdemanella biformis]
MSVGYCVKSQNDIIFRKWTTSILKDYMIKAMQLIKFEIFYLSYKYTRY